MRLRSLVDKIVKAAPVGMLTDQMIYASLDFRGDHNAHLAIPGWHAKEHRTLEMQRFEFLTGEEEIAGNVQVFQCCLQTGEMFLYDFNSLATAAEFVIGGASIFNGWIDLVLVFEHFLLRSYRATYRNKAGERVALDRRTWVPVKDSPFEDRQIEWLNA